MALYDWCFYIKTYFRSFSNSSNPYNGEDKTIRLHYIAELIYFINKDHFTYLSLFGLLIRVLSPYLRSVIIISQTL